MELIVERDFLSYEQLGSQAMHHPRKRNALADVLHAANPCHCALQTEAESRVRKGSVLSQREIPVLGLFRQLLFAQSMKNLFQIVLAL